MTDITVSTPRTYSNYGEPLWKRVLETREMALIGLLLIVIVVSSVSVNGFANPLTFSYLVLDITPTILIALPMTLVIITGEIDLSVASMMGLSSVAVGTLTHAGAPILLAFIVALIVGVIGGALNGFLVTVVGLPSLAVTIGTLALFRGLAVGLLGTTAITNFPTFWTDLAKAQFGASQIPVVVVPLIVLAIIFAIILHFTSFGRGIFAIGLNREAAAFSGVHVARTKLIVFILIGFLSALAGIYYTLRFGSARGDNATGLELSVITAVLLGGVSIFGGRGALHGVIAGVLLVGVLGSALRLAYVSSDFINIVTGALLVLSVVTTSFLGWARKRRQRPARTKRTGGSPAKN